ncbi:unnamed protein product, partial [Rotaria sp. Silwood2]
MDFKKRFNDGGDKELNVEQLEKLVSFEALRAFEHYRAALKFLGKMNQNEADIIQHQLIEPLLEHGFRADKVAHLLILIDEVPLRGLDFSDSNRKNPEHSALLEQIKILFQGVYDSPKLLEAAKKLDDHVEDYHHNRINKLANQILNPISKQDIKDSRETLFSKRLAAYQRLARLNYAIACLLAG